ncbi:MAG: prolipoprotein diacylglyceryl transferase [Elusimicrobiota bacterium]|jgi:phosphatidylglycerol:prolipoprotein diacylglycerol transferase|nr:prolipoprotein diacylglyceryl transferase [Elusimicrobiota bacterium]
MYPILVNFGSFSLNSYGLFVAIGFAVSMFYLLKRSKKRSSLISKDDLLNLIMGVIISAIIGARLMFVIVEIEHINSFWDIFKVWQGGLVYYGGFIGSVIFFIAFALKKKIKILKLLDFFAPAIALGHFFGRLGCTGAGCCYGKPTDEAWGIVFTDPNSLAVLNTPLHPTQLYEAFCNLLIFIFLNQYSKKPRKDGKVFALYLISYSIIRFIIEFFRGDFRGEQIMSLSVSQFISVFLFIAGLCLYIKAAYNESARQN